MKVLITVISLLLLANCSSSVKKSSEGNQQFYSLARRAKTQMPKQDYKKWLNKMLVTKQSHYKGYEAHQNRESIGMQQHEVMSSGATEVGGQQDIHQFKAQESGIQIKRWEQEKEVLKKQIFYLKSQLSALEE